MSGDQRPPVSSAQDPQARTVQGPALGFLDRYYSYLAFAVLALAAFNLFFRLTQETVAEWDESLYGVSAWEMTQTGSVVATTFDGHLDYYNTKPPLNVWFIALAFKTLGVN